MPSRTPLQQLNQRITRCTRCPRLIAHCRKVAKEKRASFRDWDYWGKPVPNFLPDDPPRLLVVGLAPAAHGANRTGRMFTGDRSGDFLYAALHRNGFANQPTAEHRDDGLTLRAALVTAAAHCAPPANKPTGDELANCSTHLRHTLDAMPRLAAVLTLGRIAHDAVLREYRQRGWIQRLADAPFAHGAIFFDDEDSPAPPTLCTYHPSQQNTFTGRLTEPMLDAVLQRARQFTQRDRT